jgi:hypothetical protein
MQAASKFCVISALLIPAITSNLAFAMLDQSQNTDLSYIPRLYIQGYAGNDMLARGDLLAPLFIQPDRNLFAYAQGRYSNNDESWLNDPWTGSFGVGYR